MVKKISSPQDPFLAREIEKYQTPIPSREYILSTLTEKRTAVKRRALARQFGLEDDPELAEALRRRLKAMVRDGQLMKTPEGYVPITSLETYQGTLVVEREGEGYLRTEENEKIYLSGATLRGYYDGDKVAVQVTEMDKEGQLRGRIVELLTAVTPKVVGRMIKEKHQFSVIPFERKITQNIVIPKEKKGQAKNGDLVHVQILRDEKYQFHVEPVGEIIEILGDYSTPGIEVEMAMRKFAIPHEWPKAVLQESKKLKLRHSPQERVDLTELNLITIDGEDAKDFDDAVYCEKAANGWKLWVAIADVSYYVKTGSALDKEAKRRGNSTYFPGSVIPMLPEELSNDLCSLKPQVPRLCMVCQMSVNNQGIITRSKFYRALMRSKARMTYTEVAEILKGNQALIEQYQLLLPSIEALHELYQAFYQQRQYRGAIDFDTLETRILFDIDGKIKSIVPQTRNVAHKIIEECMLAANVCAAKFIQRHKRQALFRVHDRPPPDKLRALREFLAELGLDLPGRREPTAKDFSNLLNHIKKRDDRHMIETVMLRSLSQAQYSPKNIGHFGLAYPSYLHFTSPIRRYPDLHVHRIITDVLAEKAGKKSHKQENLEELGVQCSENERRSDEATRDAALALKCHFMQDKIGQHFRGVVSGVANFGLFVELKDIYIEGLVHVTGLGNEYFHYDHAHHRMVGDRTRTTYRLGDPLNVKVVRVDLETKRIDLELSDVPAKSPKEKKLSSVKSAKRNKKNKSEQKRSQKQRRKRAR